ncbi:hypothetical protein SteCoe_17793 [Stentor coeruleus]|uniref:Uncharacterized protein n=1 Tax=Stentor coeruleus TaxID=5963 RepID=A0A1R2BY64_9CILI|nr:hypothetical protein SteCoe_17793 [Stentor coeruleus]
MVEDVDNTYSRSEVKQLCMESDIQVKIVILGNANVGKSCILHRYLTGVYSETHENTVGAKFLGKRVKCQGKYLKLNIWDTAGQERYQSFSKMYCRDAKAVILVYDVSDPETIEGMKNWYKIMSHDTLPRDSLLFIAGNKCDLSQPSDSAKSQIASFSKDIKAEYFEVSAKTGEGINELFIRISDRFLEIQSPAKKSIVLNSDAHKNSAAKKKKRKFC